MLSKQQLLAAAAGAVVTLGLGAGAVTFAQTNPSTSSGQATTASSTPMMHMPGVGGTVTVVSGNTVTVTGRDGKSYTIDAGSATITKDETVTLSDVAVGDTVMADGTLSGTTLTATSLHDGKMPERMGGGPGMHGFGHGRPNDNDADDATSTPAISPTTTQ